MLKYFAPLLVCGFLGFAAYQIDAANAPPRSTPKPRQPTASEIVKTVGQFNVAKLRGVVPEPESFRVASAKLVDDSSLCLIYRARNGIGGMSVEHAVITPKGEIAIHGTREYRLAFNTHCAGKSGSEVAEWFN